MIMALQSPPASDDARHRRRLIKVLFCFALVLILGKVPGTPTAALFTRVFSLEDLPLRLHPHLEYVLFTPLAAIVVVLFRLTLGLAVYGLWRDLKVVGNVAQRQTFGEPELPQSVRESISRL